MDLHVYTDDYDTVIARSLPDAFAVYKEYAGFEPEEDIQECWYQVPDDQKIRIYQGDGCMAAPDEFQKNSIELTAAQWVEREGRGWLCSTEC